MKQNFIFQSIAYLIDGKSNLATSVVAGFSIGSIFNYIVSNTPKEVLGCSTTLWALAFSINVWDIVTGIRADTFLQNQKGEHFKFNPDKGWRAFEKIIGFTLVIWFLYQFETEAIRLKYSTNWSQTLNYSKFIFFFYVVLIELKSIGNNNETRYGKKSELFKLLDGIILTINDGIFTNLKKRLGISKTENNEQA